MKLRFVSAAVAFALMATSAMAEPVKVFAAASLKTALDQINAAYVASGKDAFVPVYAATPALAKQIAEGAPADIFISADVKWMDDLAAKQLIVASSRKDLLGNELVLVVPSAAKKEVALTQLPALVGDGKLSVAEVKSVPAGRYAKAALEKLGLWAALEQHLAQSENVRAALAFVTKGEAAAGIVYRSDAIAEPGVAVAAVFPADSYPPIIYPVAAVAASTNAGRDEVLKYIESADAAKVFNNNGFAILP